MNYFRYIIALTFIVLISFSCKDKSKINKIIAIESPAKAPSYQKMEFNIKGMTCEIGCARLIESKLSKTKGIKFSKVSFKDSLGMVEFDINTLSQKDINHIVDKIADGTLYKATNNKIVKSFKSTK